MGFNHSTNLNSALLACWPTASAGPTEWLHRLRRGVSKSFNVGLGSSDSVRHNFNLCLTEVVPPWLVLMPIPCHCRPILLFLHQPDVLSSRLFVAYLAAMVRASESRNELIKLAKVALAPHLTLSPTKTGRISGTIRVMRSLVNLILDWILSVTICYIVADCCHQNVQAHLMMMMRMHGMLLLSTLTTPDCDTRRTTLPVWMRQTPRMSRA